MTDLHAKPQLTTIEVRNPADGSVVGIAAKARELRLYRPEWERWAPRVASRREEAANEVQGRDPAGDRR
jgi:hypothetical protein